MSEPAVPLFGRPEPMDSVDHLYHRGEPSLRWRSGVVTIETLDCIPDWESLQHAVERATRSVPRLRQKVVKPLLPTTAPRWVIDSHFDLMYHLRRVHLPAPGGMRELLDLAEITIQSTFDPARPLWTMTLVEGFAGDQAALLMHNSQAVTEGAIALAVAQELFDEERDAPPRGMPPEPLTGELGAFELAREVVIELPGSALTTTKSLLGGAFGALGRLRRDPFVVITSTQKYAGSIRRLVGPSEVPVSPALQHRSQRSRSASADVDVQDLRAAAIRSKTTVNDAYLATLCGALRIYHDAVGRPIEAISMSVPVNMRTVVDRDAVSASSDVTIAAPVSVVNPGERMRLVHRLVAAGRIEPALDVLDALTPLMTPLPDPVLEAVSELRPVPDVQVRHIRGSRTEQYVAGARVLRAYTLCTKHRVAIAAALTTRADRGTITARYDAAAVAHPDTWDRALAQAVAETNAYAQDELPPELSVTTIPEKPRPRRARKQSRSAEATAPASTKATPRDRPQEVPPEASGVELVSSNAAPPEVEAVQGPARDAGGSPEPGSEAATSVRRAPRAPRTRPPRRPRSGQA